jgi:hypothetical protein
MSQLTPLAVTKMNNETALKTTQMNNDTALRMNDQNTAGGALPKANIRNIDQGIAASIQGMSESQSRQTLIAADDPGARPRTSCRCA